MDASLTHFEVSIRIDYYNYIHWNAHTHTHTHIYIYIYIYIQFTNKISCTYYSSLDDFIHVIGVDSYILHLMWLPVEKIFLEILFETQNSKRLDKISFLKEVYKIWTFSFSCHGILTFLWFFFFFPLWPGYSSIFSKCNFSCRVFSFVVNLVFFCSKSRVERKYY